MIPKLYISRTSDGNGFPLPSYDSQFHMGLNLAAAIGAPIKINPNERLYVPVGFAVGVPTGFCGFLVSEPKMAQLNGIIVSDAPHVINPADREPLFVLLQNVSSKAHVLHRGEIIAQLMVVPAVQVTWQEIAATDQNQQTDESKMILDKGTETKPTKKDIFKSLRRPKTSIRNRYGKPEDEA